MQTLLKTFKSRKHQAVHYNRVSLCNKNRNKIKIPKRNLSGIKKKEKKLLRNQNKTKPITKSKNETKKFKNKTNLVVKVYQDEKVDGEEEILDSAGHATLHLEASDLLSFFFK